MIYKINLILIFILLYLIFYKYYIINESNNEEQEKEYIKIIIYDNHIIKTELMNQEIENFNSFLVPIEQQLKRFNTSSSIPDKFPSYCDNQNVDCNFPLYQIDNQYVSLNNIKELIDQFYDYINDLNDSQKNNLYKEIGYNLYQFQNGKLYYNNENYCKLKNGGFIPKYVRRVLPLGQMCNEEEDDCVYENDRFYKITNQIENSFCNYSKNIEVEGNIYCKNNLDISFNNTLCLSYDKYIPIILSHIIENNYMYTVEIVNYTPDNISDYARKIDLLENDELEMECPPNSTKFNDLCQCNNGYTCTGANCEGKLFSKELCYNCSCISE